MNYKNTSLIINYFLEFVRMPSFIINVYLSIYQRRRGQQYGRQEAEGWIDIQILNITLITISCIFLSITSYVYSILLALHHFAEKSGRQI